MKLLHLLIPAAALIAAPALAQAMTPTEYVMKAGASDLFERQSSQVVLETTTNAKVRDFASMMVKDHADSTSRVKAAATKSKVKVAPPKLTPAQAAMIAQLRAAKGTARDAVYITQQKTAHGQALDLQSTYARNGTAAPLKMAASSIVPVVKHHIEMLTAM